MGDEVTVHVAAPAYDSGLASESFCFIYQSIIFLVDDSVFVNIGTCGEWLLIIIKNTTSIFAVSTSGTRFMF